MGGAGKDRDGRAAAPSPGEAVDPTADDPLRHLPAVVAALNSRDLGGALRFFDDDVRLRIDGAGEPVVGRAAAEERMRELLERTADSRFQVHFSAQGHGRAQQEVTVAARPLPPGPQDWAVARGTVTWEVDPSTGLVRRAHVAVDRDALAAQWQRTAPLPAGSFRSELALASFDPDEVVHTKVTVLQDPEPRRRRRAGLVAAAVALLAGAAVVAGLLVTDEPGTAAAPTAAASEEDAGAADATAAQAAAPSGEAGASAPAAGAEPSASAPAASEAPAPAESLAPGLSPGLGVEVVEEDDGTQVLSLSDQVLFDPGSSTLSEEAGAVLGGVADRLSGAQGELVVVGHTDDVGTPETNDQLAAARAQAVAAVISARLGPGPVSIVTSARGAREPVASNETAEGRAANRRVELRFTPTP